MRAELPAVLELGRIRSADWRSKPGERFGAFRIQGPCGAELLMISSGAGYEGTEGWEHVSVSTKRRCPNWQEMQFVKNLFWAATECVIEYHVPAQDHINNHPYVLHLWKSPTEVPMPPKWMV